MASIATIAVILFVANIYIYISHKDSNYFATRHFLSKKNGAEKLVGYMWLVGNDLIDPYIVWVAG